MKWFWPGLAFLVAMTLAWQTHRLHGSQLEAAAAHTQLANERGAAAIKLAALEKQYRGTEQSLQDKVFKNREETNEQIRTLTARRDDLLKRLRIAQDNAATAALLSSTAAATRLAEAAARDPGAELPGSVGEQHVDEALRGDIIRLHLVACYRQYDEARAALKGTQ